MIQVKQNHSLLIWKPWSIHSKMIDIFYEWDYKEKSIQSNLVLLFILHFWLMFLGLCHLRPKPTRGRTLLPAPSSSAHSCSEST